VLSFCFKTTLQQLSVLQKPLEDAPREDSWPKAVRLPCFSQCIQGRTTEEAQLLVFFLLAEGTLHYPAHLRRQLKLADVVL